MPKRKATDEAEVVATPAKKKSKKQLLAEARARAAQWAEEEKAATASPAPTTPSKPKSAVSTPASKKRELPEDTSEAPKTKKQKREEARARARASMGVAEKPAKRSNSRPVEPKSDPEPEKETKPKRARSRKKLMLEKVAAEEKKKEAEPVVPPPPVKPVEATDEAMLDDKETEEEDPPPPVSSPESAAGPPPAQPRPTFQKKAPERTPAAAPQPVQKSEKHVPAPPPVNEARAQAQPSVRHETPFQQPPPKPEPARPASFPQTFPNLRPPQRARQEEEMLPPIMRGQHTQTHTQTQTQTAKSHTKNAPEQYQSQAETTGIQDEDTALERQISQKVFANAMSFKPQPPEPRTSGTTTPDVVELMQSYEARESFHDEYQEENVRRRRYPFLTCFGGLVAFAGLMGVFWAVIGSLSSPISSLVSITPPCFGDRFDPEDELPHFEPSTMCDESLPNLECPTQAVCAGGLIRSCHHDYFEVSEGGRQCVLSSAANLTLAKVEGVMSDWSVQHTCSIQGCEYAIKGEGKGPMFLIEKVQEEVGNVHEALMSLSDAFVVVDNPEADQLLVGLSDEYIENRLPISWLCFVGLLLTSLVSGVLNLLFSVSFQGGGALFSIATAQPILSFGCLVVILVMRYRSRRKAQREQLVQDVARVRELVYETLMADCAEHAALHVRDHIAYFLHPQSKEGRFYIVRKVWPQVSADIRMDNRVGKSDKLIDGRPRDVWQWLAGPPTNRAVQFSANKKIQ